MRQASKLPNQKTGAYTNEYKRLVEESTPLYESQNFEVPEELNKKERKVWEWMSNIFRQTYNCTVTDADRDIMILYCRAKVNTDEADAMLKNDNRPYILVDAGFDKDGHPKQIVKANPYIKQRHDNALLCLKFADQLGLTPLGRARAGIKGMNAKKEENVWKKFTERNDD